MILKHGAEVCEDVAKYDSYYSYPVTYYVRADGASQNILSVPMHDGVRVDAYCVNLGDVNLVIHSVPGADGVVVEAFDRGGNPVEPVVAIDIAYSYLTSRAARSFTPHEVKALSLLFMVDESDILRTLRYNRLVSMLEDRFVAIVGESVYVFSRNPDVVFLRLEDPEAVVIARERSIVSRGPIRDMREHVKSFMSGDGVTVFVDRRSAMWCDNEKCIVVRVPSNVTRLMLRDIDLRAADVDLSNPKKYRDVSLVLPSDYVVISSRGALLLEAKSGSRMRVAKVIEGVAFSVTAPLLFSRFGFIGFAHVVASKGTAQVKVVKSTTRAGRDVEEAESLTAAL